MLRPFLIFGRLSLTPKHCAKKNETANVNPLILPSLLIHIDRQLTMRKPSRYSVSFNQESFHQTSVVWYHRLNIWGKFKRACQFCAGNFYFWTAVGLCTLIEPVLCTNWPTGLILLAQVVVLGISSFLYVVQLVGVATREWEKIVMIQALSTASSSSLIMPVTQFSGLKLFIFFTAEGEYILEFMCHYLHRLKHGRQ